MYGVELIGVGSVTAGKPNDFDVDLRVLVNSDGINTLGTDMWKVGMWISPNEFGSGERSGYKEQVKVLKK